MNNQQRDFGTVTLTEPSSILHRIKIGILQTVMERLVHLSKIYALILAVFIAIPCYAEPLNSQEVFSKFYNLLTKSSKPSAMDEKEFFGGSECGDVRALLLSRTKKTSETPIWDYLRDHRDLFITQNTSDISKLKIWISSYIEMSPLGNPTKKSKEQKVLVMFPEKKTSEHGYSGMSAVIFIRGDDCYLNIGGTMHLNRVNTLYESIYNTEK